MDRAGSAAQRGAENAFGQYLRAQRQLSQLSLRQLAGLAKVSDAYLSQIERGLHLPDVYKRQLRHPPGVDGAGALRAP